jgi:hypothetical protein
MVIGGVVFRGTKRLSDRAAHFYSHSPGSQSNDRGYPNSPDSFADVVAYARRRGISETEALAAFYARIGVEYQVSYDGDFEPGSYEVTLSTVTGTPIPASADQLVVSSKHPDQYLGTDGYLYYIIP